MDKIDERILSTIINSAYDDFEALWMVNTLDRSMSIIKANEDLVISGSVEFVKDLTYDEASSWYIENHVVNSDKERLRRESAFDEVISNLKQDSVYTVNYRRITENSINHNQLVYTNLEGEENAHSFLFGFRNIDRRRTAEIDGITGLYNRPSFLLHARHLIDTNPDEEFALVMSNFVDFKRINEQYGNAVGDKVLTAFGERLRPFNKKRNMVACRFSGDLFVAIAPSKYVEAWLERGANIERFVESITPKVNIKFGIYLIDDKSESISVMCDRAHQALDTIKRSYGVSYAVFNEKLRQQIKNQRTIENCMRDALTSEQFKVFYQPKHNALTGDIIGAEALLRWIHPEYGFMSPADFIPLFEKNGFVTEADRFVLETTCKNISKWKAKGINTVPISVNASRNDFLSIDMVECFNSALSMHGIPRDHIHIEITESLMEENTELLIETLHRLREEGYQIELDDFGAGYSSINALSEFPIDVVKLDMSFMKRLDDEKRTKILYSCIDMAKNLGYKTVSEGVETKKQEELLKEFGVDAIQGYFYSKPLSEDDFEEYLKKCS